jgi:hypothetical protein
MATWVKELGPRSPVEFPREIEVDRKLPPSWQTFMRPRAAHSLEEKRQIARKHSAMISSEVERTLVKSPPELWTELSNPDALARHLGEFGEIRITRVEPEHAVEWEAGDTAGTVRIKPSGWGTKVTLTAARQVATPERPVGEQTNVQAAPVADPQPAPVAESQSEAIAEPNAQPPAPAPEPTSASESRPTIAQQAARPEPEARIGFLRRLFGGARRRHATAVAAPGVAEPEPATKRSAALAAVGEALSPETVAAANPFSTPAVAASAPKDGPAACEPCSTPEVAPDPDGHEQKQPSTRVVDISAELEGAEATAAEEVTAVLTSVLDRLGAAHHRPFSRA